MNIWRSDLDKRLAILIGKTLVAEGVGWSSPFFIPEDSFGVMLHGPKFKTIDDLAAEVAIKQIEHHIGRTFSAEFWAEATRSTFGEAVRRMLEFGSAV